MAPFEPDTNGPVGASRPPGAASEATKPSNSIFELRPDGVYLLIPRKGRESSRLCSHLQIVARTRNQDSQEWGLLLRIKDPDERYHDFVLPMRATAGDGREYRAELKARGLELAPHPDSNRLLDQ